MYSIYKVVNQNRYTIKEIKMRDYESMGCSS